MASRRLRGSLASFRTAAAIALCLAGFAAALIGAVGLLSPASQLNAVESFTATVTGSHDLDLAAGGYHVVWSTALPDRHTSHAWNVLVEVRDTSGRTVFASAHGWTARTRCSTDDSGTETCRDPPNVDLGSFRTPGGRHRFDVTVSSPLYTGGPFEGRVVLTNVDAHAGGHWALVVSGLALGLGWVPWWEAMRRDETGLRVLESLATLTARAVADREGEGASRLSGRDTVLQRVEEVAEASRKGPPEGTPRRR